MSGAKETPRQKMIGMMYLVYTALLAMNVSADILDAFAIVNDGQEKTNASIELKLEEQYAAFEHQYNKEPEKTQLYWDQALLIREKTDSIVNYIENLKLYLLLKTENISMNDLWYPKDPEKVIINEGTDTTGRRISYKFNLSNISSKDNYDAPTTIMIEDEQKATELKHVIQNYRNFVVNSVESAGVKNYSKHVGLLTDTDLSGEPIKYYNKAKQEVSWEQKHFDKVIFVAEMALLNKFVGEIQNTEYDALSELSRQIGASEFRFNNLEAKVMPKSTYVISGRNYEADIFIAAQDTTKQFNVRYSMGVDKFNIENTNAPRIQSEGGVVKLKFPAATQGFQKYAGVIEVVDPVTGEEVPYPFSASYTVAPPSATIAPTQMMIFYQGLKNPISVSSPGVAHENIRVSVSDGATLSNGEAPGTYFVEVAAGTKNVTVTASGELDGTPVVLGSYDFRVKRVPNPEAQIAGVSSGKISKDDVLAARGIVPNMGDFEFGDYSYKIVSFKLSTIIAGDLKEAGTNNGGIFSAETLKFIQNAGHGQKLYFENITAKGPDGMTRTLNPINIEIK
ncbi:MAG: GldM family protein [Bacteroidia bacterium]|nr:GldM family protein [Bacteroidia bacterium]